MIWVWVWVWVWVRVRILLRVRGRVRVWVRVRVTHLVQFVEAIKACLWFAPSKQVRLTLPPIIYIYIYI